MHGKILVIDPISTNRIVLKVKLSAAHYDVVQARTIAEARKAISQDAPDVILTSLQLPDGDASDLAMQVRQCAKSGDIPMIAIESDGRQETRLRLLAAGFDDVMTRPLDDTLLLARVRSLVRVCNSAAEWRMRDDTSRALGLAEAPAPFDRPARVTVISTDMAEATNWTHKLTPLMNACLSVARPQDGLGPSRDLNADQAPDVFILHMQPTTSAPILRLLAEIRSHARTRHSGVLVVQSGCDSDIAGQALDIGANDLMVSGFAASEIALRVQTLIRRKHIADRLRATVRTGLEAAVCDPLTGLHNRRYAMPHLARISEHAARSGKPFAVMIADMDHFKQINDVFGHATGDAVLIQTADRLRENLRAVDMIARIGGEEFLIAMPGVGLKNARIAAQRLCQLIGETPFERPGNAGPLSATISIGLAIGGMAMLKSFGQQNVAAGLLDEADKALYRAKERGRNQVTLSRPAA